MKSELVPINGEPSIPIVRDVTVIGRHESCDVRIDHVGLSQRHCVLVRTDGLMIVRDLITTNGTKVNGQRVKWAALMPRDLLSLGGYKVRIYLGSDEATAPSEEARGGGERSGDPNASSVVASAPDDAARPPRR